VRLISEEKVFALIDGFYEGRSNRELAKSVGVGVRTVQCYRKLQDEFWREEAEAGEPNAAVAPTCGCGRPVKHRGSCKFRRERRLIPASSCTPNAPPNSASSLPRR
jgi:hypothetical protein